MFTRNFDRAKNFFKKVSDIRHTTRIVISSVLNVINSFVKVLAPATFGKAVEMVAKSETTTDEFGIEFSASNLFYLSAFFTGWALIESQVRTSLVSKVERSFIKKLSLKLAKKSHDLSIADHLKLRGEIINGYLSIQNTSAHFPETVINYFYPSMMDIILGIGFVTTHFGQKTGSIFLFYALFDLVVYNNLIMSWFGASENQEDLNLRMGEFIDHQYETLSHVETVRINNRELYEFGISKKYLAAFLNAKSKSQQNEFLYHIFNKIPQLAATFMLVGRISATATIDDIDESIFLLTYFGLFASSVDSCSFSLKTIFNTIDVMDKMEEDIFNKPIEYRTCQPEAVLPSRIAETKAMSIEFCDVTFGYKKESPVIKNLSLLVPAGKRVAIVGETGSGKSTLAKLLVKFHQLDSGAIKINGADIKDIPASILRSQIGFVNQAPELFGKESLNYNIRYGMAGEKLSQEKKKAKEKKEISKQYHTFDSTSERKRESKQNTVSSLIEQVGLGKLVDRLDEPQGAMALSGGQKQQLVWARALAKKPKLMICDEPTSALDSFTESNLLSRFFKMNVGHTVLMIAHRLSTIKEMDEIVVLDQGCVVEQGTHDELMEKKGYYFNYWKLQSKETKVRNSGY